MFFLSVLTKKALTLTKDTDYSFNTGTLKILTAAALADVETTPFVGAEFHPGITKIEFALNGNFLSIGKNCFSPLPMLESILLPSKVTSIGECAFKGCTKLNPLAFIIPDSVETIGASAFEGCESLKRITFPKNDKFVKIEPSTFKGCKNLDATLINLPANVKTIGANAFEDCVALKTVSFTEKISTIEANAFKGCRGINEIKILGTATIDATSFSGCTSILRVKIYSTLTLKLSEIFASSKNMIEKVELEPATTLIPDGAFSGLSGLLSFVIPSDVNKIGVNIFDGCSSLEEITYEGSTNFETLSLGSIPSTVNVFVIEQYPSFKFGGINVDMEGEIDGFVYRYNSRNAILDFIEGSGEIPALVNEKQNPLERFKGAKEVIIGDKITGIGSKAFKGFTNIEKLTLDPLVTSIGANVFDDSVNIHEITVPGSVTGFETFANCQNINKVNIVAGKTAELTTSISKMFPKSKGAINEVKFSKSITTLPASAFADLTAVKSITIPTKVAIDTFGTTPFTNCNSLQEIHYYGASDMSTLDLGLPSGKNPTIYTSSSYKGTFGSIANEKLNKVEVLRDIKWTASKDKTSVNFNVIPGLLDTSGKLPDYEETGNISPFTVEEYANIKSVSFGEGITRVGSFLFFGRTKLDTISFPSTLESIGEKAFYKCGALTSVALPQKAETLEAYAFGDCNALTSVSIPGAEVSPSSFAGCTNIASVTINDDLDKRIKLSEVFVASKDKITTVTIGEGVEKISDSTFEGLTSVKNVEIPSTVTKISENAFKDCSKLETLTYKGKTDFSGQNLGIPDTTTVYVTESYNGGKFGNSAFSVIDAAEPSGGLSVGAIVGIVIGVLVAVAAICFCVYWFAFRKPKSVKDVSDGNKDNNDKKDDNNDEYYIPKDEDGAKV